MDSAILAPALALGLYVTAIVLPLLALLWLTNGNVALLSRMDVRLWGSLGGTLAGLWVGLAVALLGGAIAPRALLWTLIVAAPLLACAGAAIGIRAARRARRPIPSPASSDNAHDADDRHEVA